MKSNMLPLERRFVLFIVMLIAVACFAGPAFAQGVSPALLTLENKQRIELAVRRYAIDKPFLMATIHWLRDLAKNSREPAVIAQLSRLEFMNAQLEIDKNRRIQLFENCVAIADHALALDANDIGGLYWKAAAMGKLAKDTGILNALRMLRPMEKMLLRVVALDEKYEDAGGHRALGRMYYKLPGFPISFGSNQKALTHLKRAHELFPNDIITRVFYAEVLYDKGRKEEARKHADFVLATPVDEEDALEFAEYVDIALDIVRKTGGSGIKLGNF